MTARRAATRPGAAGPAALEHFAERLVAIGQEHVLRWRDELDRAERERLAGQLARLDLDALPRTIERVLAAEANGPAQQIEPPELLEWEGEDSARDRRAREAGEELLRRGAVAAFLVAGGQGTRLGYEGPKGRFPVGPLTNRSLFAYHCQRVLATSRRYGAPAPLYVMTSEVNHESTVAAFEEAGYFGLEREQVAFLVQGMLPAVDTRGRVLLAEKGSLALSPDGHGGCFAALERSGAFLDMGERGIEEVFYFQVDNPLARVLDPVFLGHHVLARAEMSTKVVAKTDPDEKVGVLGRVEGRTAVIEYSDLSPELAAQRDARGRLRYRAGNIAIHVLRRDFIGQILSGGLELPVHRAHKRVPYVDETGRVVEPDEPNAIKMEMFVFDALPLARRSIAQEVPREDEFAPVKNAEGPDSPHTARAALAEQARRWIAAAGLAPPRDLAEVGPLFALDPEEFRRNLTRSDFGPVFDRS